MQPLPELYRYYRLKGIFGKALLKILSLFGVKLRITYHYVKKLDQDSAGESSIEYKDLTLADFERQEALNPEWFTQEKLQRICNWISVEGNRAYGVYDNELLIAYGWISSMCMIVKDRPMKANVGYLWDDYTHPLYRGRGLHGELVKVREHQLLNLGKDTAFSIVDFYNRASQVAFVRAGYHHRITVYSYSIGNRPAKTFARKCRRSHR